ncbi:MAG TPA: methyltransferase domain-containing protein [Candidatus Nanoarchaeia archaeon]|nr:methyltransferase domain-containing protein [Candidatus Nanoarchaeia archaeon]
MVEKEPFQLDYERYAINRGLRRIVKKYDIKSVLEVPAGGVKALPSLYSLGFAEAGCEVSLVNPSKKGLEVWDDLGLKYKVVKAEDLSKLPVEDGVYDFVWNFNTLSLNNNYEQILNEMKRVSKKYVMILCVDGYNVGSPIHRMLHKVYKVKWTHGEKLFLFPKGVKFLMNRCGLIPIETNMMNCPVWPDTIGFRDMKFHRMKKEMDEIEWDANTVRFMKEKRYPMWIKIMHGFERFPMPLFMKHLYAHLFYVIGKKE